MALSTSPRALSASRARLRKQRRMHLYPLLLSRRHSAKQRQTGPVPVACSTLPSVPPVMPVVMSKAPRFAIQARWSTCGTAATVDSPICCAQSVLNAKHPAIRQSHTPLHQQQPCQHRSQATGSARVAPPILPQGPTVSDVIVKRVLPLFPHPHPQALLRSRATGLVCVAPPTLPHGQSASDVVDKNRQPHRLVLIQQ